MRKSFVHIALASVVLLVLAGESHFSPIDPRFAAICDVEWEAKNLAREWNVESIRRSISLLSDASDLWEEINEHDRAAECLRQIADLNITLGKQDDAIILLSRIQRLDDPKSDRNGHVKTLSLRATLALRLGRIDDALALSVEAVRISQETTDPDSMASAWFARAQVEYENGDHLEATKNYERSLALWEQIGNFDAQARTHYYLAFAYMTNDEFITGQRHAEESYQIATRTGNHQYKLLSRIAIGVLKSKLGEKQSAMNLLLQAEADFPDGVNSLEKGIIFNHLADIYADLDELKLERNYRIQGYEIYRQANFPFAELWALTKLGTITFMIGNEEAGLEYFDQAFKLAQKLKSEHSLATLDRELGHVYLDKDPRKALVHLTRALRTFRKLEMKQTFAGIQNDMGRILQDMGDYREARTLFDSALILSREMRNTIGESQSLHNIAKLDLMENDLEGSLENVSESVELADSINGYVANMALRRSYFSNVQERYDLYASLLMQKDKLEPSMNYRHQALQVIERSRARSMTDALRFAEVNSTGEVRQESVPVENELLSSLNARSARLSDLLAQDGSTDHVRQLEGEIIDLQQRLEQLKAELKEKNPAYSAIRFPEPFDFVAFQANVMDNDSLLVEFSLGQHESYLWVVGKADFAAYVLPGRDEIEGLVEGLRGLLAARQRKEGESIDEHQRRVAEAEEKYWPAARELSGMILGQAAEKIKGKRLIVVPDGKLHYFPLSALPLPDSEKDEPMVMTNEVVYQPSAQTLSLLTKMSRGKKAAERDLLIFSDPVFTADDSRLSGVEIAAAPADVMRSDNFRFVESLGSLARLPGSGTEAASITDIVGGSATDSFSGFAATRDRLLETKVSDYKILHFATHGVVNNERPELSGIVMSRYGGAGEQLNEFIRLQDIYGMKLNADLVVLSACETGVGKEVRGEGLMSLNNAFLQSGARTVLASLWKVEDGASQILMKEFYSGISTGDLTPSEALRQAQMKLARDPRYSSPFYWAAFTLQGDLNVRPAIAKGLPRWVYGLAVIPFLLLGAYLLRKKRRQTTSYGGFARHQISSLIALIAF